MSSVVTDHTKVCPCDLDAELPSVMAAVKAALVRLHLGSLLLGAIYLSRNSVNSPFL